MSAVEAAALLGSIEETAAALELVPGGQPVGVAIAVLGIIGYGAYQIKKLIVDVYKQNHSLSTIERKVQHSIQNSAKYQTHLDKYKAYNLDKLDAAQDADVQTLEQQAEQEQTFDGKPGLNFPGTKYLGPGNELNRGEALSKADRTAQIHDTQYESAKNSEDIRTADKQGQEAFNANLFEGLSEPGNLQQVYQSAVGSIGLGTKRIAENFIGDIYPTFTGKCLNQIHGLTLLLIIWMLIKILQAIKELVRDKQTQLEEN